MFFFLSARLPKAPSGRPGADALGRRRPLAPTDIVPSIHHPQNPAEWQACAAFIAAGIKRASTTASINTGSGGKRQKAGASASDAPDAPDALPASLTDILRAFNVNCVDFFRSLRKFMMAASAPLNARVKIAAKGTAGTRSSRRNRSDAADASTSPGGGAEGGAEEMDVKNGGEGLNELEALLTVSELRTSFAFTKVAAQKYRTFLDVHFDTATPGGVDLARLGWKLYLAAKHRLLPKFPDLYSCYHLLVVVQAFLLVNAPRGLLRTELKNMVSMSVRDESGDVDALASLSVTSKTKLPLLRSTMEDFQRDIVQGVVADELGGGGGNKSPKGGFLQARAADRLAARRRTPWTPRCSPRSHRARD